MPVVCALDLHDQRPSGDGPHQMHRVHGGLGAGVREAPERQAEPSRELLGHDDRVLGRLREVGAATDPLGDGPDDCRVRVADRVDAVSTVEVDVLVAVHVEHARPLAPVDPDGLGAVDLPVRRHAASERPPGPLRQRGRPGLALDEGPFLAFDQLVESGSLARPARCHDVPPIRRWRERPA